MISPSKDTIIQEIKNIKFNHPDTIVTVYEPEKGIFIIEAINPEFSVSDKSEYYLQIIRALKGKFGYVNIHQMFLGSNLDDAFTELAHLCAKSPTGLSEDDAYVLLKEVDVSFLDYCSNAGIFDKEISCTMTPLPDGHRLSAFKFSESEKYLYLAINGCSHKIDQEKGFNSENCLFRFTVRPGMVLN